MIPELDNKGLRRFGLVFGGIVAGIFGLLLPVLIGFDFPYWPWIVLLVFVCWSLIAPGSMTNFYKVWMRFGLLLNSITSRIILGAVFYFVVFPIGLLMKLGHYDPMSRRLDGSLSSYRIRSENEETSNLEKPF